MAVERYSYAAMLLILILLGFKLLQKYRLKWKVLSLGIPYLKGPPFFNNFFHVVKLGNLAPGVPAAAYIMEAIKGFGTLFKGSDLICASLGPVYYIGVISADAAQAILSDTEEVNKSGEYNFVGEWLGNGLITSTLQKWKEHRKLLTPTFHLRILEKFQPMMSLQSESMVQKLQGYVGKPFVEIDPYVSNCSLDIIAETALGIKVDAQKGFSSGYASSVHKLSALLFQRIASPWLWPKALFDLSFTGRKFRKNLNFVSNYVKKVINEKKLQIDDDEYKSGGNNKISGRAFLESLLLNNIKDKENKLSDKEIEEEVHTFTFAGYDATATAVTWTTYLLGLHPEIQDKVQHELDQVLGVCNSTPLGIEEVRDLRYMELVIKESLRLFPPVPLLGRKLKRDFAFRGQTIPKNSTLILVLPLIHRDPKNFEDPELFLPERFLQPANHSFTYIPFSAGSRNCIGQRYAMLEMKTILAYIFRSFKVTSLDHRDKILVTPELIGRPTRPVRVKLENRNT